MQGGSVMLRRAALDGVAVTGALGEDNELSRLLSHRWRIVNPIDLIATHYGVPTTLGGVLKRGYRDGVRVRALLRVYPEVRQLGNIARLMPLPLMATALAAMLLGQPWLAAGSLLLLLAFLGAFLVASRKVSAPLPVRIAGALIFGWGNLGFGLGYLRESLKGRAPRPMREPNRSY
jgi:hypothetical protein